MSAIFSGLNELMEHYEGIQIKTLVPEAGI